MKNAVVSTVLIALLVAGIVFLWQVFSPSEDGANQIQQQQQQEAQQGERGLLLGIVSSRDGEPISGATVRAVNRAGAVEEVQSGADGSYNFSLEPGSYVLVAEREGYERSIVEGVDIKSHYNFRQDIKLTTKGQSGPPPAPGDPAGYIFGKGAQNEEEVKVILAAHGLPENNEILSIVPVELTGNGLSIYYRDGQATATYVGSFAGEPAWKVDFANGDVIYVQRTCANVVIPSPSKPVVASVVVAPVVCCPTPEPVVTPEPTAAPVPPAPTPPSPPPPPPPPPTPEPTPSPTPKPTPTPTPPPTPKPTFGVVCTVEPNFGYSPLNGVDILIEVSGTATGPITYWIDCMNDGWWDFEVTTTNESYLATDLCNYPDPPEVGDSYWVLVKASRQGLEAGASCSIIVLDP